MWFLLSFIAFVSGTILVLGGISLTDGKEETLVVESVVDGVVNLGARPEGQFAGFVNITNASNERIRVVAVTSSCRCTGIEASLIGRDVMPAEIVPFAFNWNTQGRIGETSATIKIEYVQGQGSASAWLEFNLCCNVVPRFQIEPRRLDVKLDTNSTHRFRVSATLLESFKVVEVYTTHRSLRIEENDNDGAFDVHFQPTSWRTDSKSASVMVRVRPKNGGDVLLKVPVQVTARKVN